MMIPDSEYGHFISFGSCHRQSTKAPGSQYAPARTAPWAASEALSARTWTALQKQDDCQIVNGHTNDMGLPIYIDLSWFVRICLAAYRVKSYQLLKSLQEPWHALKPVILAMQVPIYLSLPKGFWALRAGETNIRSYILILSVQQARHSILFAAVHLQQTSRKRTSTKEWRNMVRNTVVVKFHEFLHSSALHVLAK